MCEYMKKIVFLISFFMMQSVISATDQECFLQGNTCFLQGQFDQARQHYLAVADKNSAVWHNLGNCYFNEKNGVQALVCWKRAQRGASFNQLGQLFDAQQQVLEGLQCPCDGIFIRGVKRVILGFPLILMQIILLLLFIIFVRLFYQCVMNRNSQSYASSCKKRYFILLLFSIVVMMLFIAAHRKFLLEKEAVIMQQKVAMHIGPETNFPQKTTLPLGCVVQVIDEQQGMIRVTCPYGTGWVVRDMVEII